MSEINLKKIELALNLMENDNFWDNVFNQINEINQGAEHLLNVFKINFNTCSSNQLNILETRYNGLKAVVVETNLPVQQNLILSNKDQIETLVKEKLETIKSLLNTLVELKSLIDKIDSIGSLNKKNGQKCEN